IPFPSTSSADRPGADSAAPSRRTRSAAASACPRAGRPNKAGYRESARASAARAPERWQRCSCRPPQDGERAVAHVAVAGDEADFGVLDLCLARLAAQLAGQLDHMVEAD